MVIGRRDGSAGLRGRSPLFPSFGRGAGAWLTFALAVPIMSLALLAGSLSLALGRAASEWSLRLEGRYTVEIPSAADSESPLVFGHGDASAGSYEQDVAEFLRDRAEVASLTPVPEEALRGLIEPWIGDVPEGLSLPRFYDLVLADPSSSLSPGLLSDLAEAAPEVRITRHDAWNAPLRETALALRAAALACVLFALSAFVLTIALAVRASLASDWGVVRLLHQLGATDGFIAREQARFAGRVAGLGGALGLGLALPVLWLLERDLGGPLSEFLSPLTWFVLFASPFAGSALAALTARLAAHFFLVREP